LHFGFIEGRAVRPGHTAGAGKPMLPAYAGHLSVLEKSTVPSGLKTSGFFS
jgi:hypothetical protein